MALVSIAPGRPASWSLDQAMAWWYGRINYEHLSPRTSDLKLDRMRALLGLLGNPHERLRIVHVAGSKGKGSTSAMLASILRRAGYRTGLFTSPHLVRVEERIQIDGTPIDDGELAALLYEVKREVDELDGQTAGHPVTFFEVVTAVGLLHFVQRRVEAAVLEVGLGGRFDSTNVCNPLVALITSISLDHTQLLGNDLASIALEKAGIVKRRRPTISGVLNPEARTVIENICQERHSPLTQLGTDILFDYQPGRVTSDSLAAPRVRVTTRSGAWPELELALHGEHQAANAALAVACVEHLRGLGWHIDNASVASGLSSVVWPARLEVVSRRPLVILDCAHNVASAVALVDTLRQTCPAHWGVPGSRQRLLVFAASGDKDIPGILRVLAPHFSHVFLTRYAGSLRCTPPEQLAAILEREAPVPHTVCPSALDAWRTACSQAEPSALLCVTGSVFLAGELRPHMLGEQ
jgi:dihydrofolate synthase/folylpolyglutamate synthase